MARQEMPSSLRFLEKEKSSCSEGELRDQGPDVSGDQEEGGTMAILPPQADLPRNRKGLPGGEGQAEGQEGRGLRKAKDLCTVFGIHKAPVCRSQNSQQTRLTLWGVIFPGSAAFTSPSLASSGP